METSLVHLRLEADEIALLDKLAGKALNRQAVARMLLIAAIEAVQKNQGSLAFPPKLTVENKALAEIESVRLNQPPVTYRRSK